MKKTVIILLSLLTVCLGTAGIITAVGGGEDYMIAIPAQTWNIAEKGQYDFDLQTISVPGSTEYRFTGSNTYVIGIINHRDVSQTVKIRRASDGKILEEIEVPGNGSAETALSTEHLWYIEISGEGGCDAGGYVK